MQEICFEEEQAATELYASFHMDMVSKSDVLLCNISLFPFLAVAINEQVIAVKFRFPWHSAS